MKLKADRDGASILHWAAAGAKSKKFGCGGHINVCKFLMDNCHGQQFPREVVNALTKDGNSAETLALDFFSWDTLDENDERKKAINLFTDDWESEM